MTDTNTCAWMRDGRIVSQVYPLGVVWELPGAPQYHLFAGNQDDRRQVNQSGEVVYLVDDDESVREAIADLLESLQLTVISFESAAGFLRHQRLDTAACLVLDLQLPEMSGLVLQDQLGCKSSLPIVFITAHGDIPSSVRAMKAGAIEFLTKPVDREALIAAIHTAFARDRENRKHQANLSELQNRLLLLSPREREVLPLVVAGFLNKQSAAMLGITEVTLQIHRRQIMHKMAAASFADLVRMCGPLGIPDATQNSTMHIAGIQPTAASPHRSDRVE